MSSGEGGFAVPDSGRRPAAVTTGLLLAALLAGATSDASPAVAQERPGDWPHYGRDLAGTKHSPLDAIDRENVAGLRVAWTWATGDSAVAGPRQPIPGQELEPGNFEATPLVVNDTMYVTTPFNRVVALEAATGDVIWTYDPETVEWGQPPNGTGLVHRGPALWTGSGPDGGERRIFLNTRWRLIALDAATGRPIPSFGDEGEVDLTEHLMWETNRLHYTQTSPPVVFEDLVILGNGVWDGFIYERDPPGNILAFDVHTGELRWRFNLIPREGETGVETWEDGSWRTTGHTNAWAPMSLDAERGLLYVPVGTPSNDYYGGHRPGDNLFAEAVVALDARTGERAWHFQTVHHGLWDYDLPGAPVLLPIEVDGRRIDAVAAAGKTGFLYVFDRATGEPVWPIEERPVPTSDVPGEEAAPTQPFPTKPPPFAKQGFGEDDVIDFTPELREKALKVLRLYRSGPLFEPPSVRGTVVMPGLIGGANWGGPAADPTTGMVYVKSTEMPTLMAVGFADSTRAEADYALDRDRRGLSVGGLPLNKPPYGTLTAFDLNRGEIVWQQVVGDRPGVRNHPALEGVELPERLGTTGAPGPIVTAGGLVFLTGGGSILYALDKATGEILWEDDLPARGYANPMTYATGDGRQFVAIATGSGNETRLVVYALERGR